MNKATDYSLGPYTTLSEFHCTIDIAEEVHAVGEPVPDQCEFRLGGEDATSEQGRSSRFETPSGTEDMTLSENTENTSESQDVRAATDRASRRLSPTRYLVYKRRRPQQVQRVDSSTVEAAPVQHLPCLHAASGENDISKSSISYSAVAERRPRSRSTPTSLRQRMMGFVLHHAVGALSPSLCFKEQRSSRTKLWELSSSAAKSPAAGHWTTSAPYLDLELSTGESSFRVPRAVFLQRSPFFRATLAYSARAQSMDTTPSDAGCVQADMEGMSAQVLRAAVVFLMTDELSGLEKVHLPELVEVADLLMVESLRACVVQEASKNVSLENLAALWRMAELLGL